MNKMNLLVVIFLTVLQVTFTLAADPSEVGNRIFAKREARLAAMRKHRALSPASSVGLNLRPRRQALPEQILLPEDRGMPRDSYKRKYRYTLQEVINLMEFPAEHTSSQSISTVFDWKVITKENRIGNGLSAIGLIVPANKLIAGGCTAFAVSKRKVLTAAHCLSHAVYTKEEYEESKMPTDRRPISVEELTFYSNVNETVDQESLLSSGDVIDVKWDSKQTFVKAEVGPWFETRSAQDDWAILTLAEDLPATVQPLALAKADVAAGEKVYPVAYGDSMVRTLIHTTPDACSVLDLVGKLYKHNCPMMTTFSGGPLIVARHGKFDVVGIMTLEKHDKYAPALGSQGGYAVSIQSLKEKLGDLD